MRRAAVAGLMLLGATLVLACSSGGYQDPKDPSVYITWRTMDLPVLYWNSLAYVPEGTRLTALPVTGRTYSSAGATYRAHHSFVCYSSSEDITLALMAVALPGFKVDVSKWPGVCSDGLNTKGLHVSSLMQLDSTGINRYTGSGPALEQLDLVNYLLARYADVASVKADLESGALKPVLNPALEIVTKVMFGSPFAYLHYNIRDNSGRSLVLQYSGPNNLQWFDSTPYLGALANNPLWQEQTAYYGAWAAKAAANAYLTIHDSKWLDLDGSFNSSHRFIRAAGLVSPGQNWEWPAGVDVSPRYALNGQPETNPALVAAMDILQTDFLPKGIDDAGGQQYPGGDVKRDIVWTAFIMDHKLSTFYYRTANTPMWKRVRLTRVKWDDMGKSVRYHKMQPGVWWEDNTNNWASSDWERRKYHSAPKMTLDMLAADLAAAQR